MDEMSQEVMKQGIEVVLKNYVDPLLKKIGERIKRTATTTAREFSIDTNLAFREYLKKAFETCSKIKTILYRTEPKFLYDFFEVPSLKKADMFSHTQSGGQKRKAVSLDDLLALADESHFIILRGTGGIGKSTLMKHLFLDELARNDLIPVYLQLKEINGISGELDFRDFILAELQRFGCKLNEAELTYALESGSFLFLLDGYDEIMSNHSTKFFKKLGVFCDQYPENYFIVSSRPRTESDFLGGSKFFVLEACPFDLAQSLSLIQKVGYDASLRDRFCNALSDGLYEKHKTFASNPLLLIIMLMTFDNYAEIPEKLHVFYEEAFDVMYRRHDVTKDGYQRERKSGVRDYDEFRMIFACFCFISYAQGKIDFCWDELALIFQKIKQTGLSKTTFTIEDYLDDLIGGLCVMYEDGSRYYFTHRSFQEYFTAVFLLRQNDENMNTLSLQLLNDMPRVLSDSVFSLVQGMDSDRFEDNVILPALCLLENDMPSISQSTLDIFSYYFSRLFRAVILRRQFAAYVYSRTTSLNFIKAMSPIMIIADNILPDKVEYQADSDFIALFTYLHHNKNYKIINNNNRRISSKELANDPEAMRLFMQTFIGGKIMYLAQLREQIEARKKKRAFDLSNLLLKNE